MSPRTISTPLAASRCASVLRRTKARTGLPRSNRWVTTSAAQHAGAAHDEYRTFVAHRVFLTARWTGGSLLPCPHYWDSGGGGQWPCPVTSRLLPVGFTPRIIGESAGGKFHEVPLGRVHRRGSEHSCAWGRRPPVAAPEEAIYVDGTPVRLAIAADGTAYLGNYGQGGGVFVVPAGADQGVPAPSAREVTPPPDSRSARTARSTWPRRTTRTRSAVGVIPAGGRSHGTDHSGIRRASPARRRTRRNCVRRQPRGEHRLRHCAERDCSGPDHQSRERARRK